LNTSGVLATVYVTYFPDGSQTDYVLKIHLVGKPDALRCLNLQKNFTFSLHAASEKADAVSAQRANAWSAYIGRDDHAMVMSDTRQCDQNVSDRGGFVTPP
jgi:hypothetical protein